MKLSWLFHATAINALCLLIECEEFRLDKENLNEEYVSDGLVRKVKLPPWACRNITIAQKEIAQFMTTSQSLLEDEILETLIDPILRLTWNEVKHYRVTYGTQLLTRALQIFAGAMLNSRYPTSIGTSVFGIEDQVHTPHLLEKLPLSPQLTSQIRGMVSLVMMDIQTQILKDLKRRVFAKVCIGHWYEVFVAILVLLASIEWVFQVQIRILKAKEGVNKEGVNDRLVINISFATQHILDEWEASAFNLIGHFRCIMNGKVPFTQSWDENADNPRRTHLDLQAIAFIRSIKTEIEDRERELRHFKQGGRNSGLKDR